MRIFKYLTFMISIFVALSVSAVGTETEQPWLEAALTQAQVKEANDVQQASSFLAATYQEAFQEEHPEKGLESIFVAEIFTDLNPSRSDESQRTLRKRSEAAVRFNAINGLVIDDVHSHNAYSDMGRDAMGLLEDDHYIKPNEPMPLVYKGVLAQKKGILISVGTFRTLVAFSIGEFDRLIMLDVSGPILKFNREHLKFIQKLASSGAPVAAQREEYIKTYREFIENIRSTSDPENYGSEGFAGWNTRDEYYWNSDILWKKVTDSLLKGNINVIRGNLGSKMVNEDLVSAIAKNKAPITIDASNVRQYVSEPKFYEALKEFEEASADNKVTILATTFFGTNKLDKDFLIQTDKHMTNYYYFPTLSDWTSLDKSQNF